MKVSRAFRLAPSPPWLIAPLIVMSLALPGSRSAFRPEPTVVNGIESSPVHRATRIIIQTGGRVHTQASGHLQNPERVYFDLLGAKLVGHGNGAESILVGDDLLKRVRIGRREGEITRVVLDLLKPAQVVASQIDNPDRFMIEVRPDVPAPVPSQVATQPLKSKEIERAGAIPPKLQPQSPESQHAVTSAMPHEIASTPVPRREPAGKGRAISMRVKIPKLTSTPDLAPGPAPRPAPAEFVPRPPALLFQPVQRTRDSSRSLTRALGLGVRRVILDPGHGGDDKGAVSRSGLREKDLVLDVAQRLGKLIQAQLNSEVIYTRSEDSFVPLEGRPALAKEKEADLFVSIHANWSPFRSAAGAETYYLNFTNRESWLEVAARENAGSGKSFHDLQSLIQEIAFSEKVNESRQLAASVESSLHGSLAQNSAEEKDRGIKQAPFVVLIGSRVPSILVEIGFLSNPQEENLLQRSDYRQRIADALYRGVAQYMSRLSHFDMAKTKFTNLTPGLTLRPCASGILSDSICGARAPAGSSAEQIRETMEKASRSNPYFQPKSPIDRQ
jgi:N-acetylmuramoyl-L-alanine amidase